MVTTQLAQGYINNDHNVQSTEGMYLSTWSTIPSSAVDCSCHRRRVEAHSVVVCVYVVQRVPQ